MTFVSKVITDLEQKQPVYNLTRAYDEEKRMKGSWFYDD